MTISIGRAESLGKGVFILLGKETRIRVPHHFSPAFFFLPITEAILEKSGAIDGKEEREKSGALGKEKDRNDERTKVDCEGAQTPHSKIPKQGMRVTLMVAETQKKKKFFGRR